MTEAWEQKPTPDWLVARKRRTTLALRREAEKNKPKFLSKEPEESDGVSEYLREKRIFLSAYQRR